MWVMSRYEDIRHVGRSPEIFSSHDGIHWNDFRYGDVTKAFFRPQAENIALLSPPRHNEIRNIVVPTSSRAAMRMRDQVRDMCRDLLRPIEPGKAVNWSRHGSWHRPLILLRIPM